jgi:probable regulatory domain-containing protein
MVIEIETPIVSETEVENLVSRVFFKAIELLGGINKLAEFRTLTWLPSLARASFVVVLKEEYMKSDEEIAYKIGLTKNTVRNILRADPELALQKIRAMEELIDEEKRELKFHTAGGIAKLAYKEVKEGIKYPITSGDELKERLKGLTIKGLATEEIIDNLQYPIKTPAILIHEIKEYLRVKAGE